MKKFQKPVNPAQVFQKAILDFTSYAIAKGYLTEEQVVEVLEEMHKDITKVANKK